MRTRAMLAAAAWAVGCVAFEPYELAMGDAETVLLFESDGARERLVVWDASRPRLSRAEPELAVAALAYAAPLEELGLVVGSDGVVALDSAGRPLLPAARRVAIRLGGRSEEDLFRRIDELRVAAPPCEVWSLAHLASGEPANVDVETPRGYAATAAFALPLGDGVLVGYGAIFEGDETHRQRAFVRHVARDGTVTRFDAELPFPSRLEPTSVVPTGFALDGRATIVWPRHTAGSSSWFPELYTIGPDLSVSPELVATSSVAIRRPIVALGFAEGAARTIMIRDDENRVWRLDPATRRWEVVLRAPAAIEADRCSPVRPLGVARLEGLERGIMSFRAGPTLRFDLARTPVFGENLFPDDPEICTSALASLPGGAEVATVLPLDSALGRLPTPLRWRRGPGESWAPILTLPKLTSDALMTIGATVFAGDTRNVLYQIESDPKRPELLPRLCAEHTDLGFAGTHLVVNGGALFVPGIAASRVGIYVKTP